MKQKDADRQRLIQDALQLALINIDVATEHTRALTSKPNLARLEALGNQIKDLQST